MSQLSTALVRVQPNYELAFFSRGMAGFNVEQAFQGQDTVVISTRRRDERWHFIKHDPTLFEFPGKRPIHIPAKPFSTAFDPGNAEAREFRGTLILDDKSDGNFLLSTRGDIWWDPPPKPIEITGLEPMDPQVAKSVLGTSYFYRPHERATSYEQKESPFAIPSPFTLQLPLPLPGDSPAAIFALYHMQERIFDDVKNHQDHPQVENHLTRLAEFYIQANQFHLAANALFLAGQVYAMKKDTASALGAFGVAHIYFAGSHFDVASNFALDEFIEQLKDATPEDSVKAMRQLYGYPHTFKLLILILSHLMNKPLQPYQDIDEIMKTRRFKTVAKQNGFSDADIRGLRENRSLHVSTGMQQVSSDFDKFRLSP